MFDSALCTTGRLKASTDYSIVSLFSGCGGLDLGFLGDFEALGRHYTRLPFRIDWANDINARACATYRLNIGDHIHQGDIWSLLHTLPPSADVVIGGFPCQDVSVNGKGAGIGGKRTSLYRAMVEVVARTRPRAFVAENVKGLLANKHKRDLETIIADFSNIGYTVSHNLYNAQDYGVPQSRQRVFIVGVSKGVRFVPPPVQLFPIDYVTAKAAIGDLESLPRNEEFSHIWSEASRSPDQGERTLDANRPGHTIRAECHGNIQFHYSLPRRISMREAARLQSFPDAFRFAAKLRETERQIGNAVPPVLAWHIASRVADALAQQDSSLARTA